MVILAFVVARRGPVFVVQTALERSKSRHKDKLKETSCAAIGIRAAPQNYAILDPAMQNRHTSIRINSFKYGIQPDDLRLVKPLVPHSWLGVSFL